MLIFSAIQMTWESSHYLRYYTEVVRSVKQGFFFFFVEMLLGVLGCVNFTMSLSKKLVWHVLIGWCKPKGLHPVLIEFSLYIITSTKYLKQDLPNQREREREGRVNSLPIFCLMIFSFSFLSNTQAQQLLQHISCLLNWQIINFYTH